MPPNRNIPTVTRRILDIQSLNRCAFPGCTHTLVEPSAGESKSATVAEIGHIHAVKQDGPRWKEELTNEELNSLDNLILLCRHHHGIVDRQPEYYTAEMLTKWKREHEENVILTHSISFDLITEIVNEKIEHEIEKLRQSRFFEEFDRFKVSSALAEELTSGSLSVGTAGVRSQALAWCVRILSSENREKAEEYMEYANDLESCHETIVAEAFLSSLMGNKSDALSALNEVNSPMSRTASLIIVEHHEGLQGAVDWVETTGIDVENLDPDGKLVLLKYQLDLSYWNAAQETCDKLTDDDFRETPLLHQLVGMTNLVSTVPAEFRSLVLGQVPFHVDRFPLDDQESAIKARRVALRHFDKAQRVALQLCMPRAAAIAEEFALWLELKDPIESENGRNRLAANFREIESSLPFVRLALQFGVKLDLDAVEREIERQIALNGKVTFDAAFARFALIFTIDTPKKALAYIDRHQDEFAGFIDNRTVQSLRIELLSQSGQFESANFVLESLIEEGLPDTEISRYRQIIAEAEGANPVEDLKEQFSRTDSLSDLGHLVDTLEARNAWDDLCEYGAMKFERTHALLDAERYAVALYNTQQIERLTEFLDSNDSLLSRSRQLQLLRCWNLFYAGKLQQACSEIEKLSDWWENPYCRELRVNIGISMGDWSSLSSVVAYECEKKDNRSAEDLIRTAQLAFHLGLPQSQVEELTFAAVEKASDNARVLADAYFLATIAGWENAEEVSIWLQKAVALSDDDGPIHKATLQEFLDQKPVWDRIQTDLWMKLRRGEIPMFGVAQVLNKSLIDIMSYSFYTNLTETDLRRKSTVFAYSGRKQQTHLEPSGKIAMDVSALLTLSSLDILDKALDVFEESHISHSTLAWFFVERKKAVFHQPSRIREARQIRDMVAEGTLDQLNRDTLIHNELADQVGQEIAHLITEAESEECEDGLQHIVVCPYPVHRVDSLMDEEADLNRYAKVLGSCSSVVKELRRKGRITEREERRALTYFGLHEKPWPKQPEITDGATLYLTYLATTYFHHLGLLEKLEHAGYRPVVSPSVVSEVNHLISYGNTADKITTVIERIRSALSSRIVTGKVTTAPRVSRVDPTTTSDEPIEQSISDHPTNGVLSLAEQFDAIVIDDRYIGQYDINAESTVTPVFSSLDVIDTLVSAGTISNEDRTEYRNILRNAGYILVPVDVDELIHQLISASVENGEVRETAELRAIRENLLLIRLIGCELSSNQNDWLRSLFRTFSEVLRELWKRGSEIPDVGIRSDWILSQLDIRIWAHCFDKETGEHMVNKGYAAHIMSLLLLPFTENQNVKEAYWGWIEERMLLPIKEQSPSLYRELVDWYRSQISSMVNEFTTEISVNGN